MMGQSEFGLVHLKGRGNDTMVIWYGSFPLEFEMFDSFRVGGVEIYKERHVVFRGQRGVAEIARDTTCMSDQIDVKTTVL